MADYRQEDVIERTECMDDKTIPTREKYAIADDPASATPKLNSLFYGFLDSQRNEEDYATIEEITPEHRPTNDITIVLTECVENNSPKEVRLHQEREDRVARMSMLRYFSEIDKLSLRSLQLAGAMTEESYGPGEVILENDSLESAIYIVTGGEVGVKNRILERGYTKRLAAGGVIGEANVLANTPNTEHLEATADGQGAKVVRIDYQRLMEMKNARPHLLSDFHQILAKSVSDKYLSSRRTDGATTRTDLAYNLSGRIKPLNDGRTDEELRIENERFEEQYTPESVAKFHRALSKFGRKKGMKGMQLKMANMVYRGSMPDGRVMPTPDYLVKKNELTQPNYAVART